MYSEKEGKETGKNSVKEGSVRMEPMNGLKRSGKIENHWRKEIIEQAAASACQEKEKRGSGRISAERPS